MKPSNLEKETIILWNEAEDFAEVYTYCPPLQKRLTELQRLYPDKVRETQEGASGCLTFQLPKRWIKVVPPRILSPAQREVLDRMNEKRRGG